MVFNEAVEYLHDIGSEGSGDGQFSNPTGLAIDKFSRLIVCDAGNKRLQLFTLEGKYITQIAGRFFKGGRPRYAVIYNTGYLFVTDSYRDCVYVFHQLCERAIVFSLCEPVMQAQKAPGGGEEEKREKQKATLFPNPEEIVLITLLASL